MIEPRLQRDSAAWRTFVVLCFAAALGAMLAGIAYLPADLWTKGYFGMGTLFLTGSSLTLAKTLRDEHEARRLINQLNEAEATRLLRTPHDAA
jgi:hypothetical protein